MSIYCDGGCNLHTKPNAWGSVVNGFGNDLICYYSHLLIDMELREVILPKDKRVIIISNFKDVNTQQNNGAELMAAVAALRIALNLISSGIEVKTIFCDSQLIVDFWSKRLKPESENKFDQRKVMYIKELIQLRREFENNGGKFIKISGNVNFADLGFHVN